jgi:hypothetical protein
MSETMTVKELAQVAGCSDRTVRRIIKEFFPNIISNGRTTRIKKDIAIDVMAKLPKSNDVDEPGQPGQIKRKGDQVKTIAQTVIETLVEMGIISKPIPTKQSVALPAMDERAEINKIVREYSAATKVPIQNLWNQLYHEALYRMHRNYKLLAEHKKITAIQVCADDNRLDELLAIAKHLFDIHKLKLNDSFLQDLEGMKI